jgi:hypothetical protein
MNILNTNNSFKFPARHFALSDGQNERLITVLFLGIILLYGISSFFPDTFLWGVNHLAFFSPIIRVIILFSASLVGFILMHHKSQSLINHKIRYSSYPKNIRIMILLVIGVCGTFIFYHLRIRTDMYGDTLTLLSLLAEKKYSLRDLFSFGDNEPLTRLIHQFLASTFGIEQKSMFQIVSAVSGGLFLVLIIPFIASRRNTKSWKLFALIILVFAGANQLFFGHVEDYTLIYLAIICFFILAWNLFDGKEVLGWMMLVFLLGTRLHIEMVLLLPALIYAGGVWLERKQGNVNRWLHPRRVLILILVSIICAIFLYIFYFDAYRYSTGDQKEIMAKIFLPMINPLPAPHAYSLLSLNHLSDFLQHLFFVASPALISMVIVIVIGYKKINWAEPRVVFSTIALFYFTIFNITVNPMLSMPRDWDMLSPIAVVLAFTALAISNSIFNESKITIRFSKIIGITCLTAIFSSTIFIINADEQSTALRLEGVGKWVFKSYYNGSSYIINMGEKMFGYPATQIEHRERTINELLPYAMKPDLNISMLYYKLAALYYQQHLFDMSEKRCSDALEYDKQNASALKTIGLSQIQRKRFDEAINLFSFYNRNINNPVIQDPQGISLEKMSRSLATLYSTNNKNPEIQLKLEQIYQQIAVK